jgi:hypothetical protein
MIQSPGKKRSNKLENPSRKNSQAENIQLLMQRNNSLETSRINKAKRSISSNNNQKGYSKPPTPINYCELQS